jgi:hypothetical protein
MKMSSHEKLKSDLSISINLDENTQWNDRLENYNNSIQGDKLKIIKSNNETSNY